MPETNKIFDLELLKKRQLRARKSGFVSFLDLSIIEQVEERLKEIQREFRQPAIIGGKAGFWAEKLALKNAVLLEDNNTLKLGQKKHDLIIHALSLHWYDDIVGQLIQTRNGLKEDGLMLAFLYGGDTLTELRSAFKDAEIKSENGLSPRVAPMADIRALGDLLSRAGFSLNVADSIKLSVLYHTPIDLLHDLRGMGETNVMINRRKRMLRRKTFKTMCEIYISNFSDKDNENKIRATFEIVCLTGWSPSDSQPKPLLPGSANTHLSKVLKSY